MKRGGFFFLADRLPGGLSLLVLPALFLPACRTERGGGPAAPPPGPFSRTFSPGAPLSLGGLRRVPLVLPQGEVRAADADGDGQWDLFLEDRILLQKGDGLFREARGLPWPRPKAFLLCDWDGDGRRDVISTRPLLHWWKGGSKALFPLEDQGALLTEKGEVLRPLPPWDRTAAALDADGNGRLDLVLGGPRGLRLFLHGEKNKARPGPILAGPGGAPSSPAVPPAWRDSRGPAEGPCWPSSTGFPRSWGSTPWKEGLPVSG